MQLKKKGMTFNQRVACLTYYGNANYGTITLSGGHVQNNLHSGQDWDMDGFSVLFDHRFVNILKKQKQVALHVTPENQYVDTMTDAELKRSIENMLIF